MEILSPAGDLEKLKYAFLYGADACYVGGYKYSLRANAKNFSINELKEALLFAHKINKKIYVTVNMIMHNEDLKDLDNYLKELDQIGVDAVIVSDLAVVESIKRQNLDLEFHMSTQLSSTNKEVVDFYKSLGASRVVLARECSKEDIQDIKTIDIELETFIHGAMCTSYSGRCVLSNYVTSRDSNRGGCSQVCRFNFEIDNKDNFAISTKDLSMIDYLKELVDLKIDSLKIEGRMRSIYYIAVVVNAYKRVLNLKLENKLTKEKEDYYKRELDRISNRENTSHFFLGQTDYKKQYYVGRNEKSKKDFLGIVLDYDDNTKIATIEQRNYFKVFDIVEVFSPDDDAYKFKVNEINDEYGQNLDAARHPKQILKIVILKKVNKFDILRIPLD